MIVQELWKTAPFSDETKFVYFVGWCLQVDNGDKLSAVNGLQLFKKLWPEPGECLKHAVCMHTVKGFILRTYLILKNFICTYVYT